MVESELGYPLAHPHSYRTGEREEQGTDQVFAKAEIGKAEIDVGSSDPLPFGALLWPHQAWLNESHPSSH